MAAALIITSALVLVLFAALVAGLSAWGVVAPAGLVSFVREVMTSRGIAAAVLPRLVLAALLWVTAPVSRTPAIFLVLAVIALAAAIGMFLVGAKRILGLIDRIAVWPAMVLRLACVVGVGFGVLLTWSVAPILAGS